MKKSHRKVVNSGGIFLKTYQKLMVYSDLYGLKSNSSGVFVGSLSHLLEVCPNVEIESCTCVRVPQYLLDALYIGTIHQKECGTTMP